jgi:prophage regulatory protein
VSKSNPVLDLPPTGYLRASQIIGDRRRGIPALLPICKSAFWLLVKNGKFPQGVLIGPRTRAWKVSEVLAALESMAVSR